MQSCFAMLASRAKAPSLAHSVTGLSQLRRLTLVRSSSTSAMSKPMAMQHLRERARCWYLEAEKSSSAAREA